MDRHSSSNNHWQPYVSVAERRRQAALKAARMKKSGQNISPVEIAGRKITTTFWGNAWCKNLEAYSDYSNRLPRGTTYVRNGSVLDLQIEAGHVRTLVSGTDIYKVDIEIKPLGKKRWTEIKGQCTGQIDSLVELLQGSISRSVMEIVTRKGEGLFPSPREIRLNCSCPDWATMCKHVAATLYGVGARLDHEPELLFTLRGVDPAEMVEAAIVQPKAAGETRKARVLDTDELSSVFGVDIDMGGDTPSSEGAAPSKPPEKRGRSRRAGKASTKKTATKKTTKKSAARENTMKKDASENGASRKNTGKKISSKKSTGKKVAKKGSSVGKATARTNHPTKTTARKKSTKKETPENQASKKKPPAKQVNKKAKG